MAAGLRTLPLGRDLALGPPSSAERLLREMGAAPICFSVMPSAILPVPRRLKTGGSA